MTAWSRQEISDATSFDYGDEFTSVAQVREYFTVAAQEEMRGHGDCSEDEQPVPDQHVLDRMAELVIANRWHCARPLAGREEWTKR